MTETALHDVGSGGGEELKELRSRLLLMAGHVEQMIAASVRALSQRDVELARHTISVDAKVNTGEVEADELCMRILAHEALGDHDLRFVALSLKMVTDLERIGDLAVNICERAVDLSRDPPLRSYEDIHRMSEVVQSMVRGAIDAFVDESPEAARHVITQDDEVDELYVRVFHEVLASMRADSSSIARGIHFQSVAKWLERMADHATNIAEQVIFMTEGEDVRHPGRLVDE
jgi:phosphate transport system protein